MKFCVMTCINYLHINKKVICFLLSICSVYQAFAQTKTVSYHLQNKSKLSFCILDSFLLGLQTVSVDGTKLKSDQTCQFPILAEDWKDGKKLCRFYKLKSVVSSPQKLELHCEIYAVVLEDAFKQTFVYETNGQIHRDKFSFAHLQIPAQICTIDSLIAFYKNYKDRFTPTGTLIWHFEPENQTIAGREWKGWKQWYDFDLEEKNKVNSLRQVGTWEIEGNVKDLTIVNLRYRGLGKIEQQIETDQNSKSLTSFMTSDILPHLLGNVPAVSPIVPNSEKINDRGYAIKHRTGAWIIYPARGAGVSYYDFQAKPGTIFCSYYEKFGNFRALTEIYPDDTFVSQTDEEWFPLTNKYTSTPKIYLMLSSGKKPFTITEIRTCWKEIDQLVRDTLSKELNFVQYEPLPGVGVLWDIYSPWFGSTEKFMDTLMNHLPELNKLGVRMIMNHSPGWINGRAIKQKWSGIDSTYKLFKGSIGEICKVYDWKPAPGVVNNWKKMNKMMGDYNIAYYVWLTGMSVDSADFAQRVGIERTHWAKNSPDRLIDVYGTAMVYHNILDKNFKTELNRTLNDVNTRCGFQGFWIDSYQNLFMSMLDWNNGTGAPMQRAWMEQFAEWSRQGISIISESQAFPGMSCSIEVQDWEKDFWYFPYIAKWLRGDSQDRYIKEVLNDMSFKFMANKCWLSPEIHLGYKPYQSPEKAITDFERLANEYLKALPYMRRPYLLENENGIVWLPFYSDNEGVLFSFTNQKIPSKLECQSILDNKRVDKLETNKTYFIKGKNILNLLNIRIGTKPDERKEIIFFEPKYKY